jgi:ribonuclease HI
MSTYCFTDGGSLNNQDPLKREAYGSFYIYKAPDMGLKAYREDIALQRLTFGNRTNNEAEYLALIACLTYLRDNGITQATVLSDSQLMLRQISGQYKVKSSKLAPLITQVLELKKGLPEVLFYHVPRSFVEKELGH